MSAGAPLPQYALHAVRTFPMCSAPSTDVGCEFALVHVASCFSAFTTSTVVLRNFGLPLELVQALLHRPFRRRLAGERRGM